MYFINSGKITVSTNAGSVVFRGKGDFFGEGALLNPKKTRSATIRCDTPVHAMEISREYFEKYLATSDSGLFLELREKDKIRKRNRAKMTLRMQKNLEERNFAKGEKLFERGKPGEPSDTVFIVESGIVDVMVGDPGHKVLSATAGNVVGENAPILGRSRNCTAVCASEQGCKLHEMLGRDFRKLLDAEPEIKGMFA